jgi:ABC-type branched-subunit amino acid transport system ATPase component
MSPKGYVRAEQLWKRFRSDRHRQLLRDEVSRLRQRRNGDASDRWRWAIQDVSFEVQPGESLALIGANGSGKSTMLKILAGIMFPTYGRLEAVGRIGALIEVRAGIHPDLTGRENVFMFGSLLGLKRSEVRKRFDAIVDFSELHDAIDRQVKFYSSGMGMRLGFAVAAFLEPDIMVVDEVLAVGDAAFQQRCLDRMREVMAGGTTLLYVSHDLATVESMCRQSLWLDRGIVRSVGESHEIIGQYRRSVEVRSIAMQPSATDVDLRMTAATAGEPGPIRSQGAVVLDLAIDSAEQREVRVVIGVSEGSPSPIFISEHGQNLRPGQNATSCRIASLPLPAGEYAVYATILDTKGATLRPWGPIGHLEVFGLRLPHTPTGVVRLSPVVVDVSWNEDE